MSYIPDAKGLFYEDKLVFKHKCNACLEKKANVRWIYRAAFGLEGLNFTIQYFCEDCGGNEKLIKEIEDKSGCKYKGDYV